MTYRYNVLILTDQSLLNTHSLTNQFLFMFFFQLTVCFGHVRWTKLAT